MKVYASYNKRSGFCYIKEEIPVEILKESFSNRELKEKYLKSKGLCVLDVKNFQIEYPTELEYEEAEEN